MNMLTIKKTLAVLLLAVVPVLTYAQDLKKLSQRLEIAQVTAGDEDSASSETIEVFKMRGDDGVNRYYLSVGHLGFGDEIVQVQIDPLFELFIPLGDTLAEALDKLKELQALYKRPRGSSIEVSGSLAFGVPSEKFEPVKVTYRKLLLSRMLDFSVEREGYIRSAYVRKTDFGSLVNSVKFYRKLHPKE